MSYFDVSAATSGNVDAVVAVVQGNLPTTSESGLDPTSHPLPTGLAPACVTLMLCGKEGIAKGGRSESDHLQVVERQLLLILSGTQR